MCGSIIMYLTALLLLTLNQCIIIFAYNGNYNNNNGQYGGVVGGVGPYRNPYVVYNKPMYYPPALYYQASGDGGYPEAGGGGGGGGHYYPPKPSNPCDNIHCAYGYKCGCLSKCPRTCNDKRGVGGVGKRRSCYYSQQQKRKCIVGCICDDGFVLNDDQCIPKDNCPLITKAPVTAETPVTSPTQPPNDCDSIRCPAGTKCGCPPSNPATCANPKPGSPIVDDPDNCTVQCYPVCRKGYLLDKPNGLCIKQANCPGYCIHKRNHEKWYECSTKGCERTCHRPNPVCPKICRRPGNWDCLDGYVREKSVNSSRCIPINKCLSTTDLGYPCPVNEEWKNCSTVQCERTCARPNPICIHSCLGPGNCDCKPQFVRDLKTCRCVHKDSQYCRKQFDPKYWFEV